MQKKIALVAIGGNALLQESQVGLQSEQLENASQTAYMFGNIIKAGYALCIVHGNGPQVGNILIQQDSSCNKIPSYTLDICDAMTQGSIGYMIEQSLINHLTRMKLDIPVVTILTEVIVDKSDVGFKIPTKPVGPFYTKSQALDLQKNNHWCLQNDAGRGYRRVVPSPRPLDIIQLDVIKKLLGCGYCVIAGGGGGIPVVRDDNFKLISGVEAVIDKDRFAALLAEKLEADTYIILTSVPKVALNFGQHNETWIDQMTVGEAENFLNDGHFPAGSMGPKIESAINFIRSGGREVLITSVAALQSDKYECVGTRVVA